MSSFDDWAMLRFFASILIFGIKYVIEIDRRHVAIENPSGRTVDSKDIAKFLWRKPLTNQQLYPDHTFPRERVFEEDELAYAMRDVWNAMYYCGRAVLIDPLSDTVAGKLLQAQIAERYFSVPDWAVVSGASVRSEARPQQVAKSLTSRRTGDRSVLYTTPIDAEQLSPASPWFLQSFVSAEYDVTVVVIRDAVFAFALGRAEFPAGVVDWRRARNLTSTQNWVPHALPPDFAAAIRQFMGDMSLHYGRIDFLLAGDTYYFLEVNPNGEWGWLDELGDAGIVQRAGERVVAGDGVPRLAEPAHHSRRASPDVVTWFTGTSGQRPWPDLTPGLHPLAFLFGALRGRMIPASVLLCVLALGAQSLETLTTVALRHLVNSITAYVPSSAATPSLLVDAAVSFIAFAAGAAGLSAIFLRVDIGIRKRLLSNIEHSLFAYTLWHASQYFEHRLPGEIAQQIRNAGQGAAGLFNTFTYYGMRFLAMVVSAGLVFSASIPVLNLFTLIWTIVFLWGSYRITKTCADLSKEVAVKSGHVVGRMVDSLRNVTIVRSFGRQAFEHSYVGRYIDEEKETHAALRTQFYRLFVFQLTCKAVLNVLVVGSSLYALLEGRTDVGSVVMLITLAGLISSLVEEISSRMYEVFNNLGTVSHALSYLTLAHAIRDLPQAGPLSPTDTSIGFEHVSFRYPSGGFAIENLSLCIRPREKVGIVGASGSGKLTLLRLLKREYEPDAGRVVIGDSDTARCTLLSLAEAIAEVPQQVRLFNRSIRENIAYARLDASDRDIWRAAEAANCLDFIGQRRDGINADVGEDGIRLSGGERQRISIARAILKNAPILLLDEATSGLDPTSKSYVQQSLARLMEGKTVIAVAHRLSTLQQMDRIIVIDEGRLVEEGSHAELLSSGDHYRRLWEDQTAARAAAAFCS